MDDMFFFLALNLGSGHEAELVASRTEIGIDVHRENGDNIEDFYRNIG
jgi:hypothetical protein